MTTFNEISLIGLKSWLLLVVFRKLLRKDLMLLLIVSLHKFDRDFMPHAVRFRLGDPAHMNVTNFGQPYIGILVSDKLTLHLQELNVTRSLQVVADLQTLLFTVKFVLAVLK